MTANPVVLLVSRVLLAAIFLVSSVWSITHFAGSSGYMAKFGLLPGDVMATLAIVIELGGGLLVLIGWNTRLAAWGLAIFCAVASFLGHPFWNADSAQFFNQLITFLKDYGLIGAFLMLAAVGPGAYSVDKG